MRSLLRRREWLAMSGAAVVAACARAGGDTRPPPALDSPPEPAGNSAIYRFRVGEFKATALLAGFMDAKPVRPPEASDTEFATALAALGHPARLRYPFNVLLLERGAERILIDAGPPGTEGRSYSLLASLARLGLGPDDVTHVFLTHAHFDHMGGLLDRDDRVVFRRAVHFCFAEEIDFWTSEGPDLSALRLKPAGLLKDARRLFSHVPFQRLGSATPLPTGIQPLLSPGHTPGHMTLRVTSNGETLYHLSDVTHHAGFWLPHPTWALASDTQPVLAVQTRLTILQQLADTNICVFGFHLPFPALGRITRVDNAYRWVPEDWDIGA